MCTTCPTGIVSSDLIAHPLVDILINLPVDGRKTAVISMFLLMRLKRRGFFYLQYDGIRGGMSAD